MTYEQIFSGQIALGRAIKHLCNRSMSLHPYVVYSQQVYVISDQSELPQGAHYWMPRDDVHAVALMQGKFLELEAEFKQKKSRRKKVSA